MIFNSSFWLSLMKEAMFLIVSEMIGGALNQSKTKKMEKAVKKNQTKQKETFLCSSKGENQQKDSFHRTKIPSVRCGSRFFTQLVRQIN